MTRLFITCLLAILLLRCPCLSATPPSTQPATGDPLVAARADTRILQAQVSSLQQKLAEADAENAQLQQENSNLRRRLGMVPQTPNPATTRPPQVSVGLPSGAEDLVIELPAVKLGSGTATEKQELISHIPGASIILKPFNGSLTVKQVNAHQIALQIHKTSKALGDDGTASEVGNLFVQSGSLYLQWAAGDQSAALDALKYASLEVCKQPGAKPNVYSMVQPEQTSVTLNQSLPVKLALPFPVASKGELALQTPSADWQSTSAADGSLLLEQNGMKVAIKLDQTGGLIATSADADPDHARRRLDALAAKYAKVQGHLAGLQQQAAVPPKTTEGYWSGALWYPPTVEDRSALISSIHSDQEDLAAMDKARPKLQAEVDAVNAKNQALARLDGTHLVMTLPNKVKVAEVAIRVDPTVPTPTKK